MEEKELSEPEIARHLIREIQNPCSCGELTLRNFWITLAENQLKKMTDYYAREILKFAIDLYKPTALFELNRARKKLKKM